MQTRYGAKAHALALISDLPDDSSSEEIIRELLLAQMVKEGLADFESDRVLSHAEMTAEVETWFRSTGRERRSA